MNIAMGIMIPFVCTTLGAAGVFLLHEKVSEKMIHLFLAAASGIMVSASLFSLLLPALQAAETKGMVSWIPVAIGLILGGIFLVSVDYLSPYFSKEAIQADHLKKTTMLYIAITLHNIPEGMAVGLMYGLYLQHKEAGMLTVALAFSIGIGIQNIPEGAAISFPLKKEGYTNGKAFICGMLSGIVEPIAAIAAMFFVSIADAMMPWLLSFAAGAMIYVVVEELIPEAHEGEKTGFVSMCFMIGFVVMLILDVAFS